MTCKFCHRPIHGASRTCGHCGTSHPPGLKQGYRTDKARPHKSRYRDDPDSNGGYSNARKALEE